jgi:hypothetical protein
MKLYQVNLGQREALIVLAENAARAIVIAVQATGIIPTRAVAKPV